MALFVIRIFHSVLTLAKLESRTSHIGELNTKRPIEPVKGNRIRNAVDPMELL